MAATFATVFVTLFVAHQVADHWIQTEYQACIKGAPGWVGRRACLTHVATYTATALVALSMVNWRLDLYLNPWSVFWGLLVSGATHYVADRRTLLKKLAALSGHAQFFALGAPRAGHNDNPSLGTGAYALDQSYHYLWLFVAALIICGVA